MPDIRNIGKLIYQLTSASALQDTDLFAISSADNLTRRISLGQIKESFKGDFYSNNDIDQLLDELRDRINNLNNDLFQFENDIADLRNSFNKSINNLEAYVKNNYYNMENMDIIINDIRSDIDALSNHVDDIENTLRNEFNTGLTNLSNHVDSVESSLNTKITELKSYVDTADQALRTDYTDQINTVKNDLSNNYYNRTSIDSFIKELDDDIASINETLSTYEDTHTDIYNKVSANTTSITNLNTTLTKRIDSLETKLNGLITYGTAIPDTLATGKVYLQYF